MSPAPGSNGNGGPGKCPIQRIPASHDYIRRDGAKPKDGWARGPADPGLANTDDEAADDPRRRRCSLRSPPCPLQLLIPRWRQPHRDPGRPGGRTGAAGVGSHRSRRSLRRRPLGQGLRQGGHQAHLRRGGAGGIAAARRRSWEVPRAARRSAPSGALGRDPRGLCQPLPPGLCRPSGRPRTRAAAAGHP